MRIDWYEVEVSVDPGYAEFSGVADITRQLTHVDQLPNEVDWLIANAVVRNVQIRPVAVGLLPYLDRVDPEFPMLWCERHSCFVQAEFRVSTGFTGARIHVEELDCSCTEVDDSADNLEAQR